MKRDTDNEQLLNEVLSESAPAEFRDAMLRETVRLARSRRRSRQFRRAGLIMMVLLAAALLWPHFPHHTKVVQQAAPTVVEPNYTLVPNEPLPTEMIITTQPLVPQQVAASGSVEIIETSTGNYRSINDDELLALVGPRRGLLIRTGPNTEELIFANTVEGKN